MHRRIAPLLASRARRRAAHSSRPGRAGRATPRRPKTVVGVAAADKRFTTLVALVKQAGLAKTLSGKGPFTVFAPTNAAFAKLKAAGARDVRSGLDRPGAPEARCSPTTCSRSAFRRHSAIAAAKKGASVKTVQGEKIALSLKGGKLVLNGSSRVIVADVKASNGVIHAIDTVLVPPSAS